MNFLIQNRENWTVLYFLHKFFSHLFVWTSLWTLLWRCQDVPTGLKESLKSYKGLRIPPDKWSHFELQFVWFSKDPSGVLNGGGLSGVRTDSIKDSWIKTIPCSHAHKSQDVFTHLVGAVEQKVDLSIQSIGGLRGASRRYFCHLHVVFGIIGQITG